MEIRHSVKEDLPRMMEIYAYARKFMAMQGNPNQWGRNNWPPEELIREDIDSNNSYVCVNDKDEVIGTFFYVFGRNIDPTYDVIEDGAWMDDSAYGVIHRLASDGSEKGIGQFCIEWAFKKCRHLRIDTHPDNKIMQNIAHRLGFSKRGIIYVKQDTYPRIAYEKTLGNPDEYKMKIKTFEELTTKELYEILKLRAEIFVVEQNCPYQDLDGRDYDSIHLFFENENGEVMACVRAFRKDEDTITLGRVVTRYHGMGIGGRLLHAGVEMIKERFDAKHIYIESQSYAKGYYAREGFRVNSEEFLEDGIPHVRMILDI